MAASSVCAAIIGIGSFVKLIIAPIVEMRNAAKINKKQNEELSVIMSALLNMAMSMKASGYNHTIDKAIGSLNQYLNSAAHQ